MGRGRGGNVTADVAEFLLVLLGQQQLQVGHPDFEQVVALIGKAKRQLEQIAES